MVVTPSFSGLEGQTPLVMGRVVGLVKDAALLFISSLLMGRFGGRAMANVE